MVGHVPEYNAPIPGTRIRAMVDKVGGGTHGHEYKGDWIVTLIDGNKTLADKQVLTIPEGATTAITHAKAAELLFIMLDLPDEEDML